MSDIDAPTNPQDPSFEPGQLAFHFTVNLEGFEGPVDLLLHLARKQKVDLAHISILELADQYMAFVEDVKKQDLQVAADYLVMAAWLAFLKSRLLLPADDSDDDDLSPQDMEEILAHRLRLLQAMQRAGQDLMARPMAGRDTFRRQVKDGERDVQVETNMVADVELYDLLKAYGELTRRNQDHTFRIPPTSLFSVEKAIERLQKLLGLSKMPTWIELSAFLPGARSNRKLSPHATRSALAATFVASLDLAKNGELELSQESTFGPIMIRSTAHLPANTA